MFQWARWRWHPWCLMLMGRILLVWISVWARGMSCRRDLSYCKPIHGGLGSIWADGLICYRVCINSPWLCCMPCGAHCPRQSGRTLCNWSYLPHIWANPCPSWSSACRTPEWVADWKLNRTGWSRGIGSSEWCLSSSSALGVFGCCPAGRPSVVVWSSVADSPSRNEITLIFPTPPISHLERYRRYSWRVPNFHPIPSWPS